MNGDNHPNGCAGAVTPPPPRARRPTNDAVADALMQRITLEAARKAAARSAAARAKREERERATAATQKV